jgi:DNA-binding MarR family transcriptional regulator
MRYRPPAQSYWSADGFAFLMGWLRDLSPTAWKVATYVAYRQLRGIVFSSEPVAVSLREIAAATGLGKTAVVDAIQEATACGILESERHEKGALGTRSSKYTINWQA